MGAPPTSGGGIWVFEKGVWGGAIFPTEIQRGHPYTGGALDFRGGKCNFHNAKYEKLTKSEKVKNQKLFNEKDKLLEFLTKIWFDEYTMTSFDLHLLWHHNILLLSMTDVNGLWRQWLWRQRFTLQCSVFNSSIRIRLIWVCTVMTSIC